MQQQFGVFQLVLAQLLARDNPGDPLITLLNPTNQAPNHQPRQNVSSPAQTAVPPPNESQAHSHVAPQPRQPPQPAVSDLPNQPHLEQMVPDNRSPQIPAQPSSALIPTPLNTNIVHEPYPPGFRMPQFETYDSTKDPDDHLHAFYSVMQAQNASDALMCKIFPSTLRGNAQTACCRTRSVAEREGESLKNYMNRFNDAVLEIASFSQVVGLATLIQGLKHERFRDSLIKHAPSMFDEANERSWKFIQAEEYALSGKPAPNKEIKNKMELRRPLPMRSSPASRDQSRYCDFHQDHGHTTQVCPGAGTTSGISRCKQPNWSWISTSTTPAPSTLTHHSHDNKRSGSWRDELKAVEALCARVMVNNCEVQRVLVDTISAPDIMYYHCFESLGLDPTLLQKYDGPIYSFNNQPVPVEGILKLNVAFGSGRAYVTPSVRFLVMKMASSFNIVIGRQTLTEIRAVVSQSHLCMKFPTPTGVATLRGNQEIARHCYMTSVSRPRRDKQLANPYPPQLEAPTQQQVMGVELLDNRPEGETRATPAEEAKDHLTDLAETFTNLRAHHMRLNPTKCVFGVESGKFLRFMVSRRRIEVNPEKIKAIEEMKPPKSIKDVQRLAGRIGALHRFVLKSAEKCLPFFKILRSMAHKDDAGKPKKFQWTSECQTAFNDLNSKLGLSQRGRQIAEAGILCQQDSTRSRAAITFQQRSSIRAQALVDFVVECTSASETVAFEAEQWTLYVDGSSSSRGSRARAVLMGSRRFRSEHALKFNFEATNNMAEYEALLLGLRLAAELKVRSLQVYSDSQLIVNQVNSTCKVTDPTLAKCLAVVLKLQSQFERFQLTKISRSENGHVDLLSKLASNSSSGLRSYLLPLLRCLTPYEAEYALREVHEGVCGSHVGALALAHKVLRQRYYWPHMQEDDKKHVQKCPKCQFFAHLTHQLAEELTTLVALWPFAQWGIDLLGETPYCLAFGTEAVIPVEMGVPSLRVTHFNATRNEQLLRENLDVLDEVREEARLRTLAYKQKLANSYNRRVRPQTFRVGDLVLRKAGLTSFETHFGKLAPNWEGPYVVAEVPYPGAYILVDAGGKRILRVWNVNNLKKFYS
ncbi:hypothetical protein SLEP1_g72 [Rubroshorea leprosula]|uniref:RNase H type-1 domain-containing protein n=1 Tax=Rubroshorea leprosula TaxID=152421 RepID=A0AAV5HI49_9ROSI|nr:hypothetical protein SLEP1_g72 [Rubroshorea leprosula]